MLFFFSFSFSLFSLFSLFVCSLRVCFIFVFAVLCCDVMVLFFCVNSFVLCRNVLCVVLSFVPVSFYVVFCFVAVYCNVSCRVCVVFRCASVRSVVFFCCVVPCTRHSNVTDPHPSRHIRFLCSKNSFC